MRSTLDKNMVVKLCGNWSQRAAVRSPKWSESPLPEFDAEKKDYPTELLPFCHHPEYVKLDEATRQRVESLAWIVFNKRVVDTEELVVSPALMAMLEGDTDLNLTGNDRAAIRQTLIDELFHTHMHEVAVGMTVRGRNIPADVIDSLNRPACNYRSLQEELAIRNEPWEKDIARIAWVIVGELSIFEFLALVSSYKTIQPASRNLLRLHEVDEAAHSSVIAEVMVRHFDDLNSHQQKLLGECLPRAMRGIAQQDWLVWQDVLELAGVSAAEKIIEDMQNDSNTKNEIPLKRSYQRIHNLCEEVGLTLAVA